MQSNGAQNIEENTDRIKGRNIQFHNGSWALQDTTLNNG